MSISVQCGMLQSNNFAGIVAGIRMRIPALMPLSDAKIRSIKPTEKPQKIADGGGLYLEVRPSGSKLWRYRYRIAGKENIFSIGEYPAIGLADARTKHIKARQLVEKGIHPSHHRQAERLATYSDNENTFEAVAREWISKKGINWSPYYKHQIVNFLTANMFPSVGKLPIRSITAAHLLKILQQVEDRGAHSVALLLRQWSSAIFRYAVVTLRADSDPAAALIGAIHRPKVKHHNPLSRNNIIDLGKSLNDFGGYRTTAIAIKLLLLTFVRTGELRKSEWSEFDLERAEWRIPKERMKMDEPHVVPLSRQAVELIIELKSYTYGLRWLFPNYRNSQMCMSATTINRALERMGFNGKNSIGFSAHGFRATASTFLNESGYRVDVIERQLAHSDRNKVRASYNQAEYMEERRTMMQDWANMVDTMMQN